MLNNKFYFYNNEWEMDSSVSRYQMHEFLDNYRVLFTFNLDGEDEVDVDTLLGQEYSSYLEDIQREHGIENKDSLLEYAFTIEPEDFTVEIINDNFEKLHDLISSRDLDDLMNYDGEINPFSTIKLASELSNEERLNLGLTEREVSEYVEANLEDYKIEHSKSCVSSNSFYLIDNLTDETVVKLSDHNTIWQKVQHSTSFINAIDSFENIIRKINDVVKQYEQDKEE